ncbi:CocE/NonD family hydrolase [Gregarina niphandrodes]|uniref:CocE/NonD family hydrolase n=1 Tax=Gregarina niphandrodes TaxID=110365 RepID=A0A023B109_GRENI|nr:CocE/NonD family hydrolase [Gregarina niphandrodes]EZG46257.1 CocE/NonD family hydrolase [Gregarina niphandrodes]|eukprot:XP_011132327.1 CocE/NonD family hydrolase [Gregarina niphandrodes]
MEEVKRQQVFEPVYHYVDDGREHGLLSRFEPGVRVLEAGYQVASMFKPLPMPIVFEKDAAVRMRDGVTIYVDVFRPTGQEKVPVIVAWSPYGKSGGTAPRTVKLFNVLGMDNSMLSGLAKFEGPDPAYWCSQGYAVCNPDARGVAHSEGNIHMIGTQEGRDGYDLIEWLATQDWCNGRVALSGTSYLAFSQWFIAAEQPPHLAAINPNEGLSDAYRDLCMRGGMPDLAFTKRLQINHVNANASALREDVYEEALRNPLANNSVWADKIPKFDRIIVPAYVVASYSNTLHTQGTFRAWRRMASEAKWLRIHNSQEWPDYYDAHSTEDRLLFFNYYLKGDKNGWAKTPQVRYAVLDLEGNDRLEQPAESFPPGDITDVKYYLDGMRRTLSPQAPEQELKATYCTETGLDLSDPNSSDPGKVSFIVRFEKETVVVGYPKVHLWVEAEGADDMDLFVLVQKLDCRGNHLAQFLVPNQGAIMGDLTEHGASVLRYKGSNGRLRVSARHLDKQLSTDTVPAHTFDRVEKLKKGEIVEVEIDMLPIGMVFYPGEQLRLVVSGKNDLGAIMPGNPAFAPENKGRHVIHTGGSRASYIQLPVKGG